MVVKSATKKRLTELGVREELAHKLATDRNMAAIKQMSSDDIAKACGLSRDDEELQTVLNVLQEVGSNRRRNKSRKITISMKEIDLIDMPEHHIKFNPLNHLLVPHHALVPEELEETELSPWGLNRIDFDGTERLAKELLPKILITDPAIQALKEAEERKETIRAAEEDKDFPGLPAGWLADRVVKVTRPSPTSGLSICYRLIVEGS
jgi:DNA-directed RNA polymerase subunit H (RpoH/RPB5)